MASFPLESVPGKVGRQNLMMAWRAAGSGSDPPGALALRCETSRDRELGHCLEAIRDRLAVGVRGRDGR